MSIDASGRTPAIATLFWAVKFRRFASLKFPANASSYPCYGSAGLLLQRFGVSVPIFSSASFSKMTNSSPDVSKRSLRTFSMAEVSQHNTPQSCWLAVRGKVYDVTSFVQKHPGGVSAILKHGGEEATEHFAFHSREAQKQWSQFQIGVLEGYRDDFFCRIS